MHTHTHMHAYAHTCTPPPSNAFLWILMYKRTCTRTHSFTFLTTYTDTNPFIHTYMHVCTHSYTLRHTHSRTEAHNNFIHGATSTWCLCLHVWFCVTKTDNQSDRQRSLPTHGGRGVFVKKPSLGSQIISMAGPRSWKTRLSRQYAVHILDMQNTTFSKAPC